MNKVVKKAFSFIVILFLFVCSEGKVFALAGAAPSDSAIDPSIMVIDEKKFLGADIDKTYVLLDENGKEFTFGSMLDKPLILLLSYFNCDGFCPTINKNLLDTLQKVKYKIGVDYRVLTISFDKHDDLKSLQMFSKKMGMTEDMRKGWRIAILKNKDDIKRLTSQVGYKFFWSYRDQMFLHPSVYIIVSPNGKVTRFLYGSTIDQKDMELSIIDAYGGKLTKSKTIDYLVSVCYSYNFKEGKYTLNYPLFIGIGALFIGLIAIFLPIMIKKKKRCV